MTMNLLKQIAGSRLPATFHGIEEIDQVRLLRAAGLVVALVPSPSNPRSLAGTPSAAQVLAITEKGREELSRLGDAPSRPPRWRIGPARFTASRCRDDRASPPRPLQHRMPQ